MLREKVVRPILNKGIMSLPRMDCLCSSIIGSVFDADYKQVVHWRNNPSKDVEGVGFVPVTKPVFDNQTMWDPEEAERNQKGNYSVIPKGYGEMPPPKWH